MGKEAAERAAGDDKLWAQLEHALVGGIQLEASGLGFLVFGVFFANASDEVTTVLGWLGVR